MKPSILDVKGIGLSTVEILAQHGIKTINDLAEAGFDRLISIPGFSGVRASSVIQEAKDLLSGDSVSTDLGEIGNLYKPKKNKKPERKTKGDGKGKKDAKSTKKDKKTKLKKKDKRKGIKIKEVEKKDKKKNEKKAKLKKKRKE